jgi:thioredoxin 1
MSRNENLIEVGYTDFDSIVINGSGYVFVDFFAPWCGPCMYMLPIISEIANEMQDLKFIKVNVDKTPIIAQKFGISGIPRFLIFKDGEVIADRTGGAPKKDMIDWINDVVIS